MKPCDLYLKFDEPVTDEQIANSLTQAVNRPVSVSYRKDDGTLVIGFSDGTEEARPISRYAELATLSGDQLNQMQIGYAGNAVCLEACDLHISIEGLLRG
jgi:hypothetical protein